MHHAKETAERQLPIVLLNTTKKALESSMVTEISNIMEQFQLVPNTQIGGGREKSTETALEI